MTTGKTPDTCPDDGVMEETDIPLNSLRPLCAHSALALGILRCRPFRCWRGGSAVSNNQHHCCHCQWIQPDSPERNGPEPLRDLRTRHKRKAGNYNAGDPGPRGKSCGACNEKGS